MSTATALTRVIDGHTVPVPGTWVFEGGNSEIAFTVKHMMISRVRGVFKEFAGVIEVAERPEESSVTVEIVAGSIDTGLAFRDKDLRGPDFLDVEQHTHLTYRSTGLDLGAGTLHGELTIAGVTREVTLDCEFNGGAVDPWGHAKIVFSARTKINREDFGLTYNKAIEGGGVLIGPTLTIEIEVQAKPAPAEGAAKW